MPCWCRRGAAGLMSAAIGLSLALWVGGTTFAQPAATRRATTLAALAAYPVFFQGQPVLVRGTLTTEARGPVLTSPDVDHQLRLILRGPSPPDGPVELRGEFWDVGRLQRDDPRAAAWSLGSVVAGDSEDEWPKPGEVLVLVVSDAASAPSSTSAPALREVALEPARYADQRVTVTGQFRGRNLYGDLPQAPGISRWDFVLRSVDAALWVTGQRPRGKGFDLDVGARVDTGHWLEASGVVREGRGLVWLEEVQIAPSRPQVQVKEPESPARPAVGPPAEVIFSDPSDGETDVSPATQVRIQFSRDMAPGTFKGRVRVSYVAGKTPEPGVPESPAINATSRYDPATRSLGVRFAEPLVRFRTVTIVLDDGVTASDGAPLKPWTLTFAVSGR